MANYHATMKVISRSGGKSCVSSLAYRAATVLLDRATGESYDYTEKGFVGHVEIITPEGSPKWVMEISEDCKVDKEAALQKLSDVFESSEKRKDARIYREFEFSLPHELTDEQNIKWANEFVKNFFVSKGMVAVANYHFDVDKKTGEKKPHCHVLLSTRVLAEEGFGQKNRDWDKKDLLVEAREQCAAYQNFALKEHGFEVRVDHRSYKDRDLEIEGQPKLGSSILDMAKRGLKLDKLDNFDAVKLRNQFRILKDPELVFSIVTSNHSTFTRHDIARVLNRYIDDAGQFQGLYDRLLSSKELIQLETKDGKEPVYTTREMVRVEMGLVRKAEGMSAQKTHGVGGDVVEASISIKNEEFARNGWGSLSADQVGAIRHMLSAEQISCVVGYAGAGKTTSLEVCREAWEASGYKVIGLAPTGKAARNIEECGIRSMTIHKFLLSQNQGREQISGRHVIVLDEAGMVDSRRFAELLSVVEKAGAKVIPMGDANQVQSIEAGPSFRLLTERVPPAVLETVVRQEQDWQREATRLFGSQQADKALSLYQERGLVKIVEEAPSILAGSPVQGKGGEKGAGLLDSRQLVDQYCLARQVSGRIWKEMVADVEKASGRGGIEAAEFKALKGHQDYGLYGSWKEARYQAVGEIVHGFEQHKGELDRRGIDTKVFGGLVSGYRDAVGAGDETQASAALKAVDGVLREMSYQHLVDTRVSAKESLVQAWARDRESMPGDSHLMLAFTNRDALSLNEAAREMMKGQGAITGPEFTYEAHTRETDDFGKEAITKHERTFAKGDRLLFTSNNKGLGVKNGSLGTVTSLDQNKMVVALDGKEAKEVSFAPKLYPYIDNGWATNIIKSQGTTVDHVKKLASFEEYRNLAYVGMSRHRKTIEVYGSSLDFWRQEKVIDRLSRVQEKLSGFDYLDAGKLEALVKEDARVLWYEEKLQQGKDLWNAVKGTARSALDQLLERPRDAIAVDTLALFENSEEKRSTRLFEKGSPEPGNPDAVLKGTKDDRDVGVNQPERDIAQTEQLKKTTHKVISYERELRFEEVNEHLKDRIHELADHLLGKPSSRSGDYQRYGNKGSLSLAVSGPKKGWYTSFETGEKGWPIDLIQHQLGLTNGNDAKKWALDWLGGNRVVVEHKVVEKEEATKRSTWTSITPVPKEVENPDIAENNYLNYMLKDGNREVARHAYRDAQGNLLGYVLRIETADGGKITPPLAYCQNERGFKSWKWQGFETTNRTPYGIDKLAQDPDKPILVVEGEKTADAAQKLLPGYHVLTWAGGAGNVVKTNWESLAGQNVTIWPDNDEGGLKAAQTLKQVIESHNKEKGLEGSVGIVSLPPELPQKWDLADQLPDGWSLDKVKDLISQASSEIQKNALNKSDDPSIAGGKAKEERNYTTQEQATLNYLLKELTTEKHSWLDKDEIENYTRQAKDNPLKMLANWQYGVV